MLRIFELAFLLWLIYAVSHLNGNLISFVIFGVVFLLLFGGLGVKKE